MALIDTTDVIDSSIFLKAKLKHNMVGDNYYIENLQHKRDQDWEYRYNIVDIEEELEKQIEYTDEIPKYTPIDVAIRNVKNINGDALGDDWCNIAFRDLYHPSEVGSRYRFALDFPDMSEMTEEQKYYKTSVWLCINRTPIKAGNSSTLRRCNTALTIVGCENRDRTRQREIHFEPCVLENTLKYMNVYYNLTVPVPQAEWYATMQLNFFSNQIKINDRFIFGAVNTDVRDNNSVYKVKAVVKADTLHTFVQDHGDEMDSTPILIIAFDKDNISPDDDFNKRIAANFAMYDVPEEDDAVIIEPSTPSEEKEVYVIEENSDFVYKLPLGKTAEYSFKLKKNDEVLDGISFDFDISIDGILEKNWDNYYIVKEQTDDSIVIGNLKTCTKGNLILKVSCVIPDTETQVTREYEITLSKM